MLVNLSGSLFSPLAALTTSVSTWFHPSPLVVLLLFTNGFICLLSITLLPTIAVMSVSLLSPCFFPQLTYFWVVCSNNFSPVVIFLLSAVIGQFISAKPCSELRRFMWSQSTRKLSAVLEFIIFPSAVLLLLYTILLAVVGSRLFIFRLLLWTTVSVSSDVSSIVFLSTGIFSVVADLLMIFFTCVIVEFTL